MIGDAGRPSEKRTLKRLGARPTPASGAIPGGAGDGETEEYVIECKSTSFRSLPLRLADLAKVTREAQASGQTGVLSATFTDENGSPRRGGKWVVVPEWLWRELTNG